MLRTSPRRHRPVPFLALAGLLSCLAGCASAAGADGDLAVAMRPVALPSEIVGRGASASRLHPVAAWSLTSKDPSFGGISALRPRGRDLLLLSDRGHLFGARRVEADDGRLLSLGDWERLPLPKGAATADTESFVVQPDDSLVIGAEDRPVLLRVSAEGAASGRLRLPPFLWPWPQNKGIEALAALPGDKGLLAITEGRYVGPDLVAAALIRDGEPPLQLAARAPDGFEPSDADIADGRLFLLERKLSLFGGLQARLVAVPLDQALAHPELPLDGEEIGRFGIGSFGENFEGVSVRPAGAGRYLIDLISDDNFNPLLRTLLVELEWRPDAPPAAEVRTSPAR